MENTIDFLFHNHNQPLMKIIALSGSYSALPTLNHLLQNEHLSALICPEHTNTNDVAQLEAWAEMHGLPCWQVTQESIGNELEELIREIKPDMITAYGFPFKVPDNLLQQTNMEVIEYTGL
jgi:methionyl-tRNA formyltransferase